MVVTLPCGESFNVLAIAGIPEAERGHYRIEGAIAVDSLTIRNTSTKELQTLDLSSGENKFKLYPKTIGTHMLVTSDDIDIEGIVVRWMGSINITSGAGNIAFIAHANRVNKLLCTYEAVEFTLYLDISPIKD